MVSESGGTGARDLMLIGIAYTIGQGVPQDFVLAHKWLNIAAARAEGENQKFVSKARDGLAKNMTSQQVADAQKAAREWVEAFEKRKKQPTAWG